MKFRYFHGKPNDSTVANSRAKKMSCGSVRFSKLDEIELAGALAAIRADETEEKYCVVFHASQSRTAVEANQKVASRMFGFVIGEQSDRSLALSNLRGYGIENVWELKKGFEELKDCQPWQALVSELQTGHPCRDSIQRYVDQINDVPIAVKTLPEPVGPKIGEPRVREKLVVESEYWNALTLLLKVASHCFSCDPNTLSKSQREIMEDIKSRRWWVNSLGNITREGVEKFSSGPEKLRHFAMSLYDSTEEIEALEVNRALGVKAE